MFRLNSATLISAIIAVFMSCALFGFKYKVASLNSQAALLEKEIVRTKCNIKILSAELRYLTAPKRLQNLASRHLALSQTEVSQLFSLDETMGLLRDKTVPQTNKLDPIQGILVKMSTAKSKPKQRLPEKYR